MVDDESTADTFAPGRRVAVPWGLDVLQGTVVDSHGEGPGRRVVVSVDLPDTDEDQGTQLVTFRATDLEAAARVAAEREPGSWLSAYQYEEQLSRVLERLLRTTLRREAILSLFRERDAIELDSPPDFTLNVGDHSLLIEAKSFSPNQLVAKSVIDQLLRYLLNSHASAALLVTNSRLSSAATERIQEALHDGLCIKAVQWDPSDDITELDQAIHDLLPAA